MKDVQDNIEADALAKRDPKQMMLGKDFREFISHRTLQIIQTVIYEKPDPHGKITGNLCGYFNYLLMYYAKVDSMYGSATSLAQ